MAAISKLNGRDIIWDEAKGCWLYEDTGEVANHGYSVFQTRPKPVEVTQWGIGCVHSKVENFIDYYHGNANGVLREKGENEICPKCGQKMITHGVLIPYDHNSTYHCICPGDYIVKYASGGIFAYNRREFIEEFEEIKLDITQGEDQAEPAPDAENQPSSENEQAPAKEVDGGEG